LAAAASRLEFSGEAGKTCCVPSPSAVAAGRILFIGLGKASDVDPLEATRRAAGTALSKMGEHGARSLTFVAPEDSVDFAAAAAQGFRLADYSFDVYRSKPSGAKSKKAKEMAVTVWVGDAVRKAARSDVARAESVAAGVHVARDLGNEPANELTPAKLASEARRIARARSQDGVSIKVLSRKQIQDAGMGALLAVADGSRNEPKLIHMTYKPKGGGGRKRGRRVVVIGKGLTFDSGGISIKPSPGMEDMKFDMCGAAAVVGLFRCLPDLGISHEVHGIIAAAENMPGGAAYRPGDVVKSMSGKTIEIINTDAEGRLTLVDAVTYAQRNLKPDVMVDLATLTGACAVALGPATGIMANDTDLRNALWSASDESGERAWPLPLFPDYRGQLKSRIADVKNLGERTGGALTAGLFIQDWVTEGLPWAHLDIAGSGWSGKETAYCPRGATGTGVRTLARWLGNLGK
jgi:leucyl aminopeptidase